METLSSQLIGCLLAETANAKSNVTLRLLSLTVGFYFSQNIYILHFCLYDLVMKYSLMLLLKSLQVS